MKPVLQALVLADHVYTDQSGKKIIAGTFNTIRAVALKVAEKQDDDVVGENRTLVPGGTELGCPWFYLSITDVVNGTKLVLQFIDESKNEMLFELPMTINSISRLQTIEIAAPLPPIGTILGSRSSTAYSFDVLCDGEILGSHRLTYELVAGTD